MVREVYEDELYKILVLENDTLQFIVQFEERILINNNELEEVKT